MERERLQGKVRWFNDARGYGFIEASVDVFVHFSAIEGDGRRTLLAGEQVSYEIHLAEQGPQARKVRRVFDATKA